MIQYMIKMPSGWTRFGSEAMLDMVMQYSHPITDKDKAIESITKASRNMTAINHERTKIWE